MTEPYEVPGGYVWYRDMVALSAVNAGMPQGKGDAFNGGADPDTGYAPRPPDDPWWVILIAVIVGLIVVGVAGAVIFGGLLTAS